MSRRQRATYTAVDRDVEVGVAHEAVTLRTWQRSLLPAGYHAIGDGPWEVPIGTRVTVHIGSDPVGVFEWMDDQRPTLDVVLQDGATDERGRIVQPGIVVITAYDDSLLIVRDENGLRMHCYDDPQFPRFGAEVTGEGAYTIIGGYRFNRTLA